MEKKVCCICGKEFEGWGNNPYGAIEENGKIASWTASDYCCDECNAEHVITGRLIIMQAKKIVNDLNFTTAEEGIEQLRSLHSEGNISQEAYDFIIANWDDLIK